MEATFLASVAGEGDQERAGGTNKVRGRCADESDGARAEVEAFDNAGVEIVEAVGAVVGTEHEGLNGC